MSVARKRGRPSTTAYPDNGCSKAPSCLACPFEECLEKLESDKHSPEVASIRRDTLRPVILALKMEGLTQEAICQRVGLSRNTIWKILKGG